MRRKTLTRAKRTAQAAGTNPGGITVGDLYQAIFSERVPESELYRTRYGRGTTLATIDQALQAAELGYMVSLTDLSSETLLLDTHLTSCVGKRFGAIKACDWDLSPAQGIGIDKTEAGEMSDFVRARIAAIPHFKQAIYDLAWGLYHGRAALETKWSRAFEDGRLVHFPTALQWIHPRRLFFGPERELRSFPETTPLFSGFHTQGVALRDYRHQFIQFLPRLFNEYPEREGLGPRCLYWSLFKRFSQRERMVLLELFGKPWRIVEVDSNSPATPDDLDVALDMADGLTSASAAQFAKGIKLNVIQPDPKSSDAHRANNQDCNDEISKLVLGTTATTDAKPAGLGSNAAEVGAEQQSIFLSSDSAAVSDAFQEYLVNAIVEVNFGAQKLYLTPKFQIRATKERDRLSELSRADLALKLGVALAESEIYEISGFRTPAKDERVVIWSASETSLFGVLPPHSQVVEPVPEEDAAAAPTDAVPSASADTAPAQPVGPIIEEAADAAVMANSEPVPAPRAAEPDDWDIYHGELGQMAREFNDLGMLTATADLTNFPNGGDDLRPSLKNSAYKVFPPVEAQQLRDGWPELWTMGGGALAALQYRRLAPVAVRRGVVETDIEEEAVRLREAWGRKNAADVASVADTIAAVKWLIVGGNGLARMRRLIANEQAKIAEHRAHAHAEHERLLLAAKMAPSPYGSVEKIVDRGIVAGAVITTAWAGAMAKAMAGKTTPTAIRAAIRTAAERLPMDGLADTLQKVALHSAMLGGLDSAWETETGSAVAPAKFDGGQVGFATKPFDAAVKFFEAKSIISKSRFKALSAKAKTRSFTVAGLAKAEMLEAAHSELARAIKAGKDLRSFDKTLAARFEAAGWTAINPSHVENVYRTNTMGAYSAGRTEQMTQPAVLKARPYWQILGVSDARTRHAHKSVLGKVFRAEDLIAKGVGPPFGYQCRCRKVSRSEKDLARLGLTVSEWSSVSDLPDDGWDNSGGVL